MLLISPYKLKSQKNKKNCEFFAMALNIARTITASAVGAGDAAASSSKNFVKID